MIVAVVVAAVVAAAAVVIVVVPVIVLDIALDFFCLHCTSFGTILKMKMRKLKLSEFIVTSSTNKPDT